MLIKSSGPFTGSLETGMFVCMCVCGPCRLLDGQFIGTPAHRFKCLPALPPLVCAPWLFTRVGWTIRTFLFHCRTVWSLLLLLLCFRTQGGPWRGGTKTEHDIGDFSKEFPMQHRQRWSCTTFCLMRKRRRERMVDMYYHCNQCWTVYVCSWLFWMSNEQNADYSVLEIHARTLAHSATHYSRVYCVFSVQMIMQLRILNPALKKRRGEISQRRRPKSFVNQIGVTGSVTWMGEGWAGRVQLVAVDNPCGRVICFSGIGIISNPELFLCASQYNMSNRHSIVRFYVCAQFVLCNAAIKQWTGQSSWAATLR